MKKEHIPYISLVITILVAGFGNNIYQQITGRSAFADLKYHIDSTLKSLTSTETSPPINIAVISSTTPTTTTESTFTPTATNIEVVHVLEAATFTPTAPNPPTSTPTNQVITITANTPAPVKNTPVPVTRAKPCTGEDVSFDGTNVTINKRGDCHISLAAGEIIAGTADRFQEDVEKPEQPQPPCAAFVIKGPIEMDLKIWYGGWNYHSNISDDNAIQNFLDEKVRQLQQQHQPCVDRGIDRHILP